MLHALIMAGGSGTRFWPASRQATPKQLLRLVGDETMLQATAGRLSGLIPPERVMVMTGEHLVPQVQEQLPAVPPELVVGEPSKRDTAPCVGLAAALMAHRDPDAVMLVLPADHVIESRDAFQAAVRTGAALLEAEPDRIVTFGIRPTYASESFGYIERAEPLGEPNASAAFRVARFREKPDQATAAQYLAAGTFYWNSGIFLWRARTILDALRAYEPEMAARIDDIARAIGTPRYEAVLRNAFAAIEGKSIDYAVLERHPAIAMVEAPFHWDDVGSWQAIARMHGTDEAGNTVRGRHIGIGTRGSIIQADGDHVIVTIGVEDLIVVQTPEATLVAPKGAEERVREAVKRLEAEGLEHLL